MKRLLLAGLVVSTLSMQGAAAITLKDAAQEAVLRNPEVLARWHTYKAASEEIGTATGARLPKIDLSAGVARENKETPLVDYGSYTRSGMSVYLNQMLFDGFATRSEIKRLSYAQRVRYFEMLDASENAALEAARAPPGGPPRAPLPERAPSTAHAGRSPRAHEGRYRVRRGGVGVDIDHASLSLAK